MAEIFSSSKLLTHHRDRVDAYLRGEIAPPVTMEFDMTNICNHHCPQCSGGKSAGGELSLVEAQDWIGQMAEYGVRGLIFTGGGEPLCNPDTLEAIKYAHERGLSVGLITNGSLLHTVASLRLVMACEWIRVSVDAYDAATYRQTHGCDERGWNRVLWNIGKLVAVAHDCDKQCTVGVGYLVGQDTKAGMLRCVRLFDEEFSDKERPDYIQFRPFNWDQTPIADVFPVCKQYARQGFQVLASEHKYRRFGEPRRPYKKCHGASFVGTIQADGNLSVCCYFRGVEKYYLGNLRTESFKAIWEGERKRQVVNSIDMRECVPFCRCDGINREIQCLCEPKPHKNFL